MLNNMCEIIDMTNVPEGGFTAKEDITCYKVLGKKLGDGYVSPVYPGTVWKPDGLIQTAEIVIGGPGCIEGVYYSDMLNGWARDVYNDVGMEEQRMYMTGVYGGKFTLRYMENLAWSAGGFHTFAAYMNGRMEDFMDYACAIMRGIGWCSVSAVRCVIPAGSRYYVSDDGMAYVSDALAVDCIVSSFSGRGLCRAGRRPIECKSNPE